MNEKVVEYVREKIKTHYNNQFALLYDNLCKMMKTEGFDAEKHCNDHKCLLEFREFVTQGMQMMGKTALSHNIDPHDLTEEVLLFMLEGNRFARKAAKTAQAFKDDEQVGFC